MTAHDTLRLIRDRLEHVMHTKRSTQAWANELPAIHKLIVDALEPDGDTFTITWCEPWKADQ